MLQWLISLLLLGLFVQLCAAIMPGIEVEGRVPALTVAAALVAMGNIVTRFAVPLPVSAVVATLAYACVGNIVAVGVMAAILPRVHVKALSGVIGLGVLVTFATLGIPYAWQLMNNAGVLSAVN
jgi:hypothetical protein